VKPYENEIQSIICVAYNSFCGVVCAGAVMLASSVRAQTYTILDDPLGVNGTYVNGISGNNIVGYYVDSSGHNNGFLYNGSTYTT